jgi:nitrogen fixation/metabolism regulation signal transduction histidine kinase
MSQLALQRATQAGPGRGAPIRVTPRRKKTAQPRPSIPGDAERFFSSVMANIPARVWIKDDRGRYVFVNSRLCSDLAIEREKWIGSKDEELFPNAGHVYWRKDLQVLSGGEPLISTDQVEGGKSLFVVRFPLTIDGETHVAAVGVETTEQITALIRFVHLRDELFRNERLRSIGQMTSGLAHDLRNILNAGALRLNILRMKAGTEFGEDMEALARTLNAAAERVRGLQEFVNERPQETLASCDLSVLIDEAVEMVDFLIEKTPTVNGGAITLERSIAESLPKVPVFPNQVKHVLANLLINGREAMPDGGNLLIEANEIQSTVEVTVADEGTGIAPEVFDKMFDPFFTTKELGTGLGLSMARDVMTRLGGQIRAENRTPRGAAFILNFPIIR